MNEKIINDFYDKWELIRTNDKKFEEFKERVNWILNRHLGEKLLKEDVINEIKLYKGSRYIPSNSMSALAVRALAGFSVSDDANIYKLMLEEKDVKQYMLYLQIIFILESINYEDKVGLCKSLEDVIKLSGFSNVVYIQEGEEIFRVLPSGEEFLDKGLINDTLRGLKQYSQSYELYIKSLEEYLYLDIESNVNKRDIADKLRLSFEKYLKERFNSKSSKIKDVINKDVCLFLKESGINENIRAMYSSFANEFEKYSNEQSKHNIGSITNEELEYLIYLVGLFIRLIYKIDLKNNN